MKKKEMKTKAMAVAMSATMAASICPAVPAMAVTKDQVAKDGVYTKTAHVTRTEADVDDEWDEYDVEVSLTVKDGKFSDITVTPGEGYTDENKTYLAKAYSKSKGIQTLLKDKDATQTEVNAQTINLFKAIQALEYKGSNEGQPDCETEITIDPEKVTATSEATIDGDVVKNAFDGDTSTNDTVLLLANGMAENPEINEKNEDYQKFCEALNYINTTLAKKIAGDGEGATALFEVKIIGAESKEQAVTLSKSIVTSSLTKAAIYGHDANWGRILCAMGYSGAQFDPEKVDLYFESKAGKIQIIENGVAVDYSEEEATRILSEDAVTAIADVKMGDCTATAWGCDLTYDYIKINADYRS